MIEGLLSLYRPKIARTIAYMLQSTEYEVKPYLAWFWRTNNFNKVTYRRDFILTKRSKLLLMVLQVFMSSQFLFGLIFAILGIVNKQSSVILLGLLALISYPVLWAVLIILPLEAARLLVAKPQEKKLIASSRNIFKDHTAIKIAVAGSYGKTTVKELLLTILSEGKKVAATPANKNVAVSHAQFAQKLDGDEDIVIVEYGEGRPGDVAKFAQTTKPDIGIITGLAPAHLDKYKTLDAAAKDIFSLATYLKNQEVYVNGDSSLLHKYIKDSYSLYNQHSALGWKISNIKVKIDGLHFEMSKGKDKIKIESGLIGRHLVGPLALCAALANKLGLTIKQIENGAKNTKPFEHRMQPRPLAGGWVIDDTYNGNLEGIKAGTQLLKEIPAKTKIYVTPGLVDQGKEAEPVHTQVGQLIAEANPDKVILMKNSVTKWIQKGLTQAKYKGEVIIQEDPLNFYTNLDQIIAAGDVIMMQNDWTDNYN